MVWGRECDWITKLIIYNMNENLTIKIKEEINSSIAQHPSIFTDEVIDYYFKVLDFSISDPTYKLEGLKNRIPNAMSKLLIEDISKDDKDSFFSEFAKIEPFLKKIVFLVSPQQYALANNTRLGLAKWIELSGLNPNNIQLSNINPNNYRDDSRFIDHILRCYELRNIESHTFKKWNHRELYQNLESLLIVYLYAIYLNLDSLKNLIMPKKDYQPYLQSVLNDFKNWKERFVHITGIEKFEEISIRAIESESWGNGEHSELREGKIDDLRKSIQENSMIILGEPGMGKSTTMQYLAYNDANDIINNNQKIKFPLYIELKLLSKEETIISACATKLSISEKDVLDLFNDEGITLLLDGLNEVFVELRLPLRKEIFNLIEKYPNSFFIITSRPLAYSNEFKSSPVFNLQKLNDSQVEEFLNKNCQNNTVKSLISQEIHKNLRLGKIVRVPLLLKMFITVVVNNQGLIPENKTQIISDFIQNLYKREQLKLVDSIDLRIIHRLLCFLGYNTREKNSSNGGWRIEQFEALIEKRIEKSRFNINVYQFIDMSVDLHLLVKDGEKYSFIHELYQEYFASEELFRLQAS